jgi:hypothetical protein
VTVAAPAGAEAGVSFDVTVDASLHNNGPLGPVDAALTVDLNLPTDCTASVTPTIQSPVQLATSTDTPIATATWTVSCTDPSDHVFAADVSAVVDEEVVHVIDPDSSNNSDSGEDTTAVTAEADLKVVEVTITAPEAVGVNEAFDVSAAATLHNNGPFGPVNADATITLDVPTGCTAASDAAVTVLDIALAVSTATAVTEQTWSVTCSDNATEDFSADVTLVSAVHLTDPDDANDSGASEVLSVAVGPSEVGPLGTAPAADSGSGIGLATILTAAAVLFVLGASAIWLRRRQGEI